MLLLKNEIRVWKEPLGCAALLEEVYHVRWGLRMSSLPHFLLLLPLCHRNTVNQLLPIRHGMPSYHYGLQPSESQAKINAKLILSLVLTVET